MDPSPDLTVASTGFPFLKLMACALLTISLGGFSAANAQASPATSAGTTTNLSQPSRQSLPLDSSTAAAMAAEFRELRAIPGHFGGGKPDPRVDHWQGRKHQLMQLLGPFALEQKLSLEQLEQLLGPPDRHFTPQDPHYSSFAEHIEWQAGSGATTPGELLIYDFRSGHDQMIFSQQNNEVSALGWFHAYE